MSPQHRKIQQGHLDISILKKNKENNISYPCGLHIISVVPKLSSREFKVVTMLVEIPSDWQKQTSPLEEMGVNSGLQRLYDTDHKIHLNFSTTKM